MNTKSNEMSITLFAKTRKAASGKTFQTFLTTLHRADGTEQKVDVKFREECGEPKSFPCNVIVDKSKANIVGRSFTRADGTVDKAFTLWVANWRPGEEYVDHSLDEFI